ncbi:MAG: pentapeptide repeat-containing protein [Myxococcota bacterium]
MRRTMVLKRVVLGMVWIGAWGCNAIEEAPGDITFDDDRDGDSVLNAVDNCPDIANPDQADINNNGTGDACDVNSLAVTVQVLPEWLPSSERFAFLTVMAPNGTPLELNIPNAPHDQRLFLDLSGEDPGDYQVIAERPGFSRAVQQITLTGIDKPAPVTLSVALESLGPANISLDGQQVSDTALAAIDLRNANLAGAVIRSSDSTAANLCGLDMSGAVLTGADLTGANLSGAILRETTFANAVMPGVDLSGAQLDGASLLNTSLSQSTLMAVAAPCMRAIPEGSGTASLIGTNLSSADLTGSTLLPAPTLQDACDPNDPGRLDLSQVNLAQANLTGAVLDGVTLNGTDLSGTLMTQVQMR